MIGNCYRIEIMRQLIFLSDHKRLFAKRVLTVLFSVVRNCLIGHFSHKQGISRPYVLSYWKIQLKTSYLYACRYMYLCDICSVMIYIVIINVIYRRIFKVVAFLLVIKDSRIYLKKCTITKVTRSKIVLLLHCFCITGFHKYQGKSLLCGIFPVCTICICSKNISISISTRLALGVTPIDAT